MKSTLVDEATEILENAGYQVSNCSGLRSCFDLLARKDRLLLIKVLANVDGLTRQCSLDLMNLASVTSAIPLVLGDHTKSTRLCRGIIYARYNIYVVNIPTFGDIVGERMPLVYSVRGNYCVRIDSTLLVRLRKRLDMTQQELADELGVSKQSVHRYEFSGRMSVDVAERLMGILRDDIALPSEVFILNRSYDSGMGLDRKLTRLKELVVGRFRDMGFFAVLTNAPFDIVAVEGGDEKVLATVSDDGRRLGRKMDVTSEVSEMIGGYGMCVSNRCGGSDVVVMKPGDLGRIRDSRELIEVLADS
jgi:predicted transcriptional regulator